MPPPWRALTGTWTVPLGAVSGIVNAGWNCWPVAGSTRPGSETTSVGEARPVTPVRSYVTGTWAPVTTAGTRGASAKPCTPAEAGPNVSETLAVTVVPPTVARYVSGTVRGV